ncbi:MAG TPA: DUF4178 domain-containing protein [Polyangiales bacterium]|nr:DUF4178 domain-containing protein [Polyangiales bacterium]
MPDLVAIDTRLALGDSGRMQQLGFEVLGRLQLNQGTATWNEWYVGWSDGSFGWLAEARGRVIVSHRVERKVSLPGFEVLQPGDRLTLAGLGSAVIEEVGEAEVLSAQGELPFQPQLNAAYRFVDASMSDGMYATLDYGQGSEEPEVFMGRELAYTELELRSGGPAREDREPESPEGVALRCPDCSAPIALKLSSSLVVVCPSCGKVWSHSDGRLELLAALQQRHQPALPLGARGKLFDHDLEVIGWTRRALTYAGTEYSWEEYLLHGDDGYFWLSENKGHWVFLAPLPAAAVTTQGEAEAYYESETFQHFQTSEDVRYADIQGEFFWALQPSARAKMIDYVRPPYLLSVELIGREKAWTRGEYVPAAEIWKSFGLTTKPPEQNGVAPCQPNPHRKSLRDANLSFGLGLALLVLITVVLQIALPKRVCLSLAVPMTDDQAVTLSDPFVLKGGVHAALLRARSEFSGNGWVGLDLALIHEATGKSDELGMDLSYFAGYTDGESWFEDNRRDEARLGSVAPGSYVLRVAPHFEAAYPRPDTTRVEVVQGVYLWLPFWLCLIALSLPSCVLWVRRERFEGARWSESDHH